MHRPRPSRIDLVLAGVVATLGQATTWLRLDTPEAFAGDRLLNALVAALVVVPLLWMRNLPLAAVGASAAILAGSHSLADLDVTVLATFVPLVVVTAACGYHGSPRQAVTGAGVAVLGLLVVSMTTLPELRTPVSMVFNLLVLLGPWAAARALRHREDRARRLGAELVRERRDFEERVAVAVERQRAEIARELHDIVAHGVSVMIVQIGGARLQAADQTAANRSLLQAEDAGREALADLRRMLGVLRTAPLDAVSGQPRPGLAQVSMLADQARASGVDIDWRTEVGDDPLPAAVDVSAYRIVQEAITNALKHSRAKRATIMIERTREHVVIDVYDSGPSRAAGTEAGYGLIGIRERAAYLGGRAMAGPAPEGGWRVRAELPLMHVARAESSR